MMTDYGKARLVQLEEDIELFNEMGATAVKKLTGILNAVRVAMADLKDKVDNSSFKDIDEEIQFFKYVKPQFYAHHIYALELFKIDTDKPLGDQQVLRNYYEQELKFIRKFLNKHLFLYQYYLLDGSELDSSYFVRGKNQVNLLLSDGPDLDPLFSTACDYLFARFIAIEKLQEYLIQCLYHSNGMEPVAKFSKKKGPFKWTGDKSNLIELAYGIYDTVQINDGHVTIAEIIEWLEESLEVSLSRYYRRFTEIKMRKSISKTKYLDDLRDALAKHIAEGDAYKPLPLKSLSKPK
ncbi:RteC domain-containing protein [Mucilaginibacter mallensis]|nr:RteC domain-containing protein [Mucilaginibacter mallensis]